MCRDRRRAADALLAHPVSAAAEGLHRTRSMSADEIRARTQDVWDRFYSLPAIWQRSACVRSLRARLAFVLISKLYRQMYANTGIATDSARVERSARRARWLARAARRLFARRRSAHPRRTRHEHLRECRVGDCGLQLPAESIDRFRSPKWTGPAADAHQRANGLIHQMLVDYVTALSRLAPVPRCSTPTERRDQRGTRVPVARRSDAGGWGRFGALRRHLFTYPVASTPDARDLLIGRRRSWPATVASVTHLAIVPAQPTRPPRSP